VKEGSLKKEVAANQGKGAKDDVEGEKQQQE
jgi:hypothetical protein